MFSVASCCSNGVKTVKGVVADASMNNIFLLSNEGDTLSFSTMDAERICPTGILIGDSIDVFYTGKLNKGISGVNVASKIVVSPQFLGSWVQPIPGIGGEQGFTLNADGTASSINMSTLVFKTWAFDNGQLLLSGESIGNGVTINFTDTVVWKVAPIDTLNIVSGGYTDSYSRK